MAAVTVYSTMYCPYCRMAESLLDSLGVDYKKVDLTHDRGALADLKRRTGMRTVPQIFVGDELIGGFDDLSALHRSGGFLPKLS